jgi:hypothetical protein
VRQFVFGKSRRASKHFYYKSVNGLIIGKIMVDTFYYT